MRVKFKDSRAFERGGKDLLDFARAYLSEAFPNPDRQGCPLDAALRSFAFNPTQGAPGVTEHLASCSPCFRRYRELLAELKSQKEKEKEFTWDRISVWTKAHPVLVGTAALCLLLIAIGVGFFLRSVRQPNAPPVETNRRPNPSEPQNLGSDHDITFGEPRGSLRLEAHVGRPDILVEKCASASAKRQNTNSG